MTGSQDFAVPPPAAIAGEDTGTETAAPVPLKGEVCTQYVRCNKPGCRCHDGVPHGPYYYRVWREGGRVHKEYVREADVARVRAACEAYKALTVQLRALRREREQIARHIQAEWRRAKRLWRQSGTSPDSGGPIRPPTPPRTAP